MDKQWNVTSKLFEIFKILATNKNLDFYDDNKVEVVVNNNSLLQINAQEIILPLSSKKFIDSNNPLQDNFVDLKLINKSVQLLSKNDSIIGLNHVGFCYKVRSQKEEKERIKNIISKTKWHLYEMESNDEGLWLFIGNNQNWQDPMIELLPVKNSDDKRVNTWLPHIHIDIDTTLNYQEIENYILKIFNGNILPFRFVIHDVVYGVRTRLGIINGVNIFLDIATKERDRKYSRKNLLSLVY